MSSYDYGKAEVCEFIRKHFKQTTSILDVGAGDGKWRKLLPEYEKMDACECFDPNAEMIQGLYRKVFTDRIEALKYRRYGLVIFGDVIEHLTVENATATLLYALSHASAVIVAVPWRFRQGAIYGNPYEVHIQDDLTPEIFEQRYGYYQTIWANRDYCYYYKQGK